MKGLGRPERRWCGLQRRGAALESGCALRVPGKVAAVA